MAGKVVDVSVPAVVAPGRPGNDRAMTTTPTPTSPERATAPRTVVIVMFDGVQSLDVTGPLEVFAGAARAARKAGVPGYRALTATLDARPVRTTSGLLLTPHADLRALPGPDSTAGEPALDLLLVAGGEGALEVDPDLLAWVGKLATRARLVASVCSGAFVLAEAGLLAGRDATTHWAQCAAFAERYPDVTVHPDEILVRDGDLWTSGGVTAGVDLALAVVTRDLGHDLALVVARHLLVNLRRPGGQAPFGLGPTEPRSPTQSTGPLGDLRRWVEDHLDADLTVGALARRVNLSERQFTRAFQAEVGIPPGRYVDEVRLRAACRLLEETSDSVATVARRTGHHTAEALRRAFVRTLGIPPTEYRRRF
jgi:transcriptional regulator GlxA family with amidase domain